MSKAEKAEQRAFEAYPVLRCYNDFQMVEEDINKSLREIYQEGYHQAEKDLELTWEDIGKIISINQYVCGVMGISDYIHNYQQAMEEVLKRFKEKKMNYDKGTST